MRYVLGFDPYQHEYGPATEAIRQILLGWESIDWFAATSRTRRDEATQLVRKYNDLGHAYAPELFSADVDLTCRAGGWPEFMAWCTHVRTSSEWDWKFSALKPLTVKHSKARGWSLNEQVMHEGTSGRPGDLFFRIAGVEPPFAMWCPLASTVDEPPPWREKPAGKAAEFYRGYAHGDAIHCIEWQLAEGSNDLSGNPFVPLLHCYRAGFYPFAMTRESMMLFEFTTAELPERCHPRMSPIDGAKLVELIRTNPAEAEPLLLQLLADPLVDQLLAELIGKYAGAKAALVAMSQSFETVGQAFARLVDKRKASR